MSNESVKIEVITLDDGRRAERHTTVDENGNTIVEIFAEEKRPLKLEKRIKREMKQVVAKEIHEVVKDGQIAYQEVKSFEAEVPLQVRERIGLADHHKIVDGDYVRKEELHHLIADGVVAGMSALMDRMEPVVTHEKRPEPIFKAQEVIEKNVEEKKKSEMNTYLIMGAIAVAQVVLFAYFFLF